MDSLAYRLRRQTFRVRAPFKIVYARLIRLTWWLYHRDEDEEVAYAGGGRLDEEGFYAEIEVSLHRFAVFFGDWKASWSEENSSKVWWTHLVGINGVSADFDYNLVQDAISDCVVDLDEDIFVRGIATVGEDGESELSPEATYCVFDQIRQEVVALMPEFRRRLGQRMLERVHIHLSAVRSEETDVLLLWNAHMEWAYQEISRRMKALWEECANGLTPPSPTHQLAELPMDVNDPRIAHLDKCDRELIVEVNSGFTPAEIAKRKFGDNPSAQSSYQQWATKRLNKLRNSPRDGQFVKPADPARRNAGKKGAASGSKTGSEEAKR